MSGPYGGNLVLRDLGAGSHLFLPVAKPGGRMWTGDVHALQGDGVVDQTAIETAAEDLQIRYDLHKRVALRGPLGETDTSWIMVAFAASLDDALVACLREVIYWLPAAAGITGPEAYALASMAVSFRVAQYANQNRVGLHLDPAQIRAARAPRKASPRTTRPSCLPRGRHSASGPCDSWRSDCERQVIHAVLDPSVRREGEAPAEPPIPGKQARQEPRLQRPSFWNKLCP